MKNTKVMLVPLTADDREQFILDNQWAFKHGALYEFGKRDDHIDAEGEIISRETIETCIDTEGARAYRHRSGRQSSRRRDSSYGRRNAGGRVGYALRCA